MAPAEILPDAHATLTAHQAALSAFARARTAGDIAAVLEELAKLQRKAIEVAREIEAQVIEYGRPSPLTSLLDVMRKDADQVARGFALVATALDQMRRNVVVGSWSVAEVRDVIQTQAQQGDLYFEQLGTLVERSVVVGARVARYFDAAFGRVEADPVWADKVNESLEPDGTFRGTRLADLPDDVDG